MSPAVVASLAFFSGMLFGAWLCRAWLRWLLKNGFSV